MYDFNSQKPYQYSVTQILLPGQSQSQDLGQAWCPNQQCQFWALTHSRGEWPGKGTTQGLHFK